MSVYFQADSEMRLGYFRYITFENGTTPRLHTGVIPLFEWIPVLYQKGSSSKNQSPHWF